MPKNALEAMPGRQSEGQVAAYHPSTSAITSTFVDLIGLDTTTHLRNLADTICHELFSVVWDGCCSEI